MTEVLSTEASSVKCRLLHPIDRNTMKVSELVERLTAMSTDTGDLPVQIYDFTDTFQIDRINMQHSYFGDNKYELVAATKRREQKITTKEFIRSLKLLIQLFPFDLEMLVSLPNDTEYCLAGVGFDQREQAYAITLGTEILPDSYLDKNTVTSFYHFPPVFSIR